MKFFFTFIFFISFLLSSFASVEGLVEPVGNKKLNLLLGDSVNLKLSFWPKDLTLYEDIKKLKRSRFLNVFYIIDIEKFEISKNNYDVINIYIKAVAVKPYKKTPFTIWNNGSKNIPIEIRKISVKDFKDRSNQIVYYSTKYSNIYKYKDKGLLFLFFMLVLYLIFNLLKSKNKKKKI